MPLRYDEDFVEAAVFLCAAGRLKPIPGPQIARFHREREALYSIVDRDEQSRGFFSLSLEWFREWGWEDLLREAIDHFPLLRAGLDVLAIRRAQGKQEEGAELYVNDSGARHGVLAMRPERLAQGEKLAAFLGHELFHLQDMVDPAFGYRPVLEMPHGLISPERLARERYRVLWDVSIDGRLTRAERPAIAGREQRWLEFSAAFSFWPEKQQQQVFAALWNDPHPSHGRFQELACDPRQRSANQRPEPGALCPLCGFPTFAWAEPGQWPESVVGEVRREFPRWSPDRGACRRCLAVYRCRCAGRESMPA